MTVSSLALMLSVPAFAAGSLTEIEHMNSNTNTNMNYGLNNNQNYGYNSNTRQGWNSNANNSYSNGAYERYNTNGAYERYNTNGTMMNRDYSTRSYIPYSATKASPIRTNSYTAKAIDTVDKQSNWAWLGLLGLFGLFGLRSRNPERH